MMTNYPLMRNNILPEDLKGVIELLQTQDPKLTQGPYVRKFEQEWSQWLGVKYSLFVNSGSSANLLAIAWLREKYPEGGKIIVPPFTWSSDISSVYWCGFEPLFIDITLNTLACNEELVEEALEKYDDIRAVFLTHAQGINGLTQKIIDACKRKNVYLVEDVCESHGSRFTSDIKAGAVGDISCFSYYYAHHMSTIEGGMVCTNDEKIYQYLRMARSHGMLREASDESYKQDIIANKKDLNEKFIFITPGFNVRNNEIGAIIGLSQLERLDNIVKKRAKNFKFFLDKSPEWIFKDFNMKGQSNYAFNIILKEKDNARMKRLQDILKNNNVEFRRGSAGGGNQLRQPYIEKMNLSKTYDLEKDTPVAEHIHFYGLYIGNYPDLDKNDIIQICEMIKKA